VRILSIIDAVLRREVCGRQVVIFPANAGQQMLSTVISNSSQLNVHDIHRNVWHNRSHIRLLWLTVVRIYNLYLLTYIQKQLFASQQQHRSVAVYLGLPW